MCLTCAFRFVYITRKIWNVSHSDSVVDVNTASEVERLFGVRAYSDFDALLILNSVLFDRPI